MRDDPAGMLLAIVLAALLAAALTRLVKPRHDPWQPEELSMEDYMYGLRWTARPNLGPPFPSPTNGKNHV